MNEKLKAALEAYETAKANLEAVRSEVLPAGTVVQNRLSNDKRTVLAGSDYPDCVGFVGGHWQIKDLV